MTTDKINPSHYQKEKFEVIEVIEILCDDIETASHPQKTFVAFCLGNCIKYLLRCCEKDDIITNLKKCRWYLDKAIATLEKH